MIQHEIRKFVAVAALAALAPAPLSAQGTSMKPEQGWAEVARCARSDSEAARHACLDRLLRGAGLLTAEMSAQQQRRAFGLEEKVAPAAVAPVPQVAPAPEAKVDRLEVAIVSVQKSADGRLAVTTDDGALWRQTESVEIPQPPAAGDRMAIRKGALNGYRCSFPATRLTFRCIRSR